MKRLVIATRKSRLALWQAEHVRAALQARRPDLAVELLPMSTRGDELLQARLDEAGGKGLFVKELEAAMADGRAHLAVHSMKDVPAELPPGFVLPAILSREDPRDAFVSVKAPDFAALPTGSVVGTSSLRREAQIAARFPGLRVQLLRGNVETRLAKLDRGEYDAAVLAVAGLRRLGLESRIRAVIAPEAMLPAPGQGALGIECREADVEVVALVAGLADSGTSACVHAERTVSRALGGNCSIPLGAFAEATAGTLRLRALVASRDGKRIARADCEGPAADPVALGERAAQALREQGAVEILAALGN
jgi:hydroxymethylbilane synthase